MNQAGKLYLQHVGLLLDCTLRRKHDAMTDVRHIVTLYLEDMPDASYEDIVGELGNPEHMAEELMMDIPVIERIQGRRMQKRIYQSVIGVLLVMVIAAVGDVVYVMKHAENYVPIPQASIDPMARYEDNAITYFLNYELDENGNIVRAINAYGEEVPVNEDGVPIG